MFARFDMDRSVAKPLTKSTELDDASLWQRFKSGNNLAFSVLYKKYVQRLFSYGMHACYDKDLVTDCLQELFARLWDRRAQLGDVEVVNSYLFKSFRRLLLNRLQQNRKRNLFLFSNEMRSFEILSSFEDSIITQEIATHRLANLKKAIAALTKRQREVIYLKFYNELSYKEVAPIMEMSVESVYNLMTKAIESLRVALKSR